MNLADRLAIKQFRSESSASYVVSCPRSREALVIDPRVELMEDYREYVVSRGLKPTWVVDTRMHADHFSASHLLRQQHGSEIGMSDLTPSARATRKLRSGDRVAIGTLSFQILQTPGVAPDALCVYGEGMIFTGHTVGVGSLGGTELPGALPKSLWESIHQIVEKLPDSTLVYPALLSDFLGNDLLFSTIAVERRSSPEWQIRDLPTFVVYKNEHSPPLSATQMSGELRLHLEFNRETSPASVPALGFSRPRAAPPTVMSQEPGSISVTKYAPKLKERAPGSLFIDVREPEEFREGRMPGVKSIPISELGLHLEELRSAKRVYLSCLAGPRSLAASKTLSYLGLVDVVNVTGGYRAWVTSGFEIEKS
jgi:glyoxylase-like metal-dependent hydrolase (beta-lactamase superfamily II)/rhodanese-related sulfurtransferase